MHYDGAKNYANQKHRKAIHERQRDKSVKFDHTHINTETEMRDNGMSDDGKNRQYNNAIARPKKE